MASTTAEPGLERDAIGMTELLFQSITHMAPAVATALSIGAATTVAGGITPLAVVFAMVAVLFTAYSMSQLARHLPSAGHLRFVSSVLRIDLELERIGHYAATICREALQLEQRPPQPLLSDFEVIDLSSAEAATRRMESQRIEALGAAARRHFLLLFDLSFASPTSIHKARLAARDFLLSSLHPADLAAVALYSLETGPQLILAFTPDRAQLARAIDSLGLDNVHDAREDPLRFLIDPDDFGGERWRDAEERWTKADDARRGQGEGPDVAYPRAARKSARMLRRLAETGFVSFLE